MNISALFIRRPVLSTVVALMMLLLGFEGLFNLQIRQYPKVDETVITITTVYPGASPELIQGFITSKIAAAVATTVVAAATSRSRSASCRPARARSARSTRRPPAGSTCR